MAAIAHGWTPPESSGIDIPRKVATEFNQADKGGKMLKQAMTAKALRKRSVK
jgi:hypothetical protein